MFETDFPRSDGFYLSCSICPPAVASCIIHFLGPEPCLFALKHADVCMLNWCMMWKHAATANVNMVQNCFTWFFFSNKLWTSGVNTITCIQMCTHWLSVCSVVQYYGILFGSKTTVSSLASYQLLSWTLPWRGSGDTLHIKTAADEIWRNLIASGSAEFPILLTARHDVWGETYLCRSQQPKL